MFIKSAPFLIILDAINFINVCVKCKKSEDSLPKKARYIKGGVASGPIAAEIFEREEDASGPLLSSRIKSSLSV